MADELNSDIEPYSAYREKIEYSAETDTVDWSELATLYQLAFGRSRDPTQLERSFQRNYATCVARESNKIIGAGRAISDGEYYGVVFDVAVLPTHQGQGIGRVIMSELIARLTGKMILLTTTVGKQGFYSKLGFKMHKTAMAIYPPHRIEDAQKYLTDYVAKVQESKIEF